MLFPRPAATLVACLLLPAITTAQPWADAYRAGDYGKAATLLHTIAADYEYAVTGGDPAPIRQLAVMYAKGLGVARDPISACTLATWAEITTGQWAPREFGTDGLKYLASLREAERFRAEYCSGLSPQELGAVSPGCLALRMPETVLAVGSHSVRVGRRGIHLVGTAEDGGGFVNFCPVLVARVRATSVPAPTNAAPGVEVRHFVELFSWAASRSEDDGAMRYVCMWQAYEVHREGVRWVAQEELLTVLSWPEPADPADLDTILSMEMIRSGHVRWRVRGAPLKRGWIMLPEEQ